MPVVERLFVDHEKNYKLERTCLNVKAIWNSNEFQHEEILDEHRTYINLYHSRI